VHKFTELARYAPDDVSTEVKKMARFLKGLIPELKTILASQDFISFSHLSNKAMQVERAKDEEKAISRGNSKSSGLSSKIGTRKLDPLDFRPRDQASVDQLVKGKCALGPFLSILVIECKHKCLNVNLCPWMNKVQITSKGMFLSLSTLVLSTNILV
jgi:hypothetical protein